MKLLISLTPLILTVTIYASSVSTGGGSSGGTWGSITGTLSNQSDLNTALSGKVAASGGTLTSGTAATGLTCSYATASTIAMFNSSKGLVSSALTESGDGNNNISFVNPSAALSRNRLKWGNASIGSSGDNETNTFTVVADTYKVFLVDGSFTWSADNTNMRYRAAADNNHYMGFNVPNSTTQTLQASDSMNINVNVASGAITAIAASTAGNLTFAKSYSATPKTVDVTADNQSVTVSDTSYLRLTSDNATAASRTIVLGDGAADGQELLIECAEDTATGQNELPDNTANNVNLTTAWACDGTIGVQYSNIRLVWNSGYSNWTEISRAKN